MVVMAREVTRPVEATGRATDWKRRVMLGTVLRGGGGGVGIRV